MGVVYKLKDDIIQYILDVKQANLALSCRQIAEIASQKFQFNVSKSSINALIKSAQLSSPVGRRTTKNVHSKKFEIPIYKKKELLDNTKPLLPSEPVLAQPPRLQVSELNVARQTIVSELVNKVSIRDQLLKAPIIPGVGTIFLKAAQWEISKKSILEELFRKHAKEALPENFGAFCEALGCMKAFPLEVFNDITKEDHAFWKFNGFSRKPDMADFYDCLKRFDSSSLSFEYNFQMEQAFLDVRSFKIITENNDEIKIDAQLAAIWQDNVFPAFWNSSYKALSHLSSFIISNIEPLMIFSSTGRIFNPCLFNVINCFENLPGYRIKQIIALNHNGSEIVNFSTIPSKKRRFVIGVWPWQDELQNYFKKETGQRQSLCDEISGTTLYFEERALTVQALPNHLKAIMSYDASGNQIAGLVTNMSDAPSQEIISLFLKRWPHLSNGYLRELFKVSNFAQQRPVQQNFVMEFEDNHKGPEGIFENFARYLINFCQFRFFDERFGFSLKDSDFCWARLFGSILTGKDYIHVNINQKLEEHFRQARERINEAVVKDRLGRRLIIYNYY